MKCHEFIQHPAVPRLVFQVLRELGLRHERLRLIMISPVMGYYFTAEDDMMEEVYREAYSILQEKKGRIEYGTDSDQESR